MTTATVNPGTKPAAGPQGAAPTLAERLGRTCVGVRRDLEVSRHVFRRRPCYIIRDPVTFQSHRLEPDDYHVMMTIDASRSLADTFEALVEHGYYEREDQEQFFEFVFTLHRLGFLRLPISDDKALYKRHQAKRAARNWLRLGRVLEDGPVELQVQRPRLRAACTAADLSAARLQVSSGADTLELLRDGDAGSSWSAAAPMQGREWLRVELPAPLALGRVELSLAAAPGQDDPELALRASPDLATWRDVPAYPARPRLAEQLIERRAGSRRPLGQALVLEPELLQGLEIRQLGVRPEPWRVSELRLLQCREEPRASQ